MKINNYQNNSGKAADPLETQFGTIPELQPVVQRGVSSSNTEFSSGTVDESMLTDEEKRIVDQFVKDIDLENVDAVVSYGLQAQSKMSDFSSSMLSKVKTFDLGDVGESLRELTVALDETASPDKKGFLGLFKKAKHSLNVIRANYAKAESNVDRIEKDLQNHMSVLTQDISFYQRMYELNVKYYRELTLYIIAGKKALSIARSGKLQELRSLAETSQKAEDVQNYKDFEDLCVRFEKELSNLEITRMISIQSAPQVRMLQNNDREMLDKLRSSISNTIPLWRNQLVLSLGIEHTSRALQAQQTLTDKTNELLLKNSETLRIATVETAKRSERPIVDIATLQQCNRDLISSISEVVRIHEQGMEQRSKTREELLKLETELKQAVLNAASQTA